MQLNSESKHTLTLTGGELRALLASVRSSLAVSDLGSAKQRDVWESIARLVSDGPTDYAPAALDYGHADRCIVCGSGRVSYENHKGQLFCWPCADGQDWPKHPRANRAT